MVTDKVCEAKHKDIDRRLEDMHADLLNLRDNHIAHLQDKIDKVWIVLVLLGVISGGQLVLKLLGF